MTNINPCYSNQYMLFSTNSKEPTREWNRYSSSGKTICCLDNGICLNKKLLREKLNYTVMKYQNDNGGPGVNQKTVNLKQFSQFVKGTSNTNFTRNPTNVIQFENILYYVDQQIMNLIHYEMKFNSLPKLTVHNLKNTISYIRSKYNIQLPVNVLLQNVPLSQFKTRTTYLAGNNNWSVDPTQKINTYDNPLNFNIPYKVGNTITTDTIIKPLKSVLTLMYTKYLSKLTISTTDIQYIYVLQNNTCTYTGKTNYLFPAKNDIQAVTSASFWGSNLLTKNVMDNYMNNNILSMTPIFIIIQPASWKVNCGKYYSKFGILISFNIFVTMYKQQFLDAFYADNHGTPEELEVEYNNYKLLVSQSTALNSDLIFIPIQTQLGLINTIKYPIDYNVNIPFTIDANTDLTIIKKNINEILYRYFTTNNIQYKLLKDKYDNTSISI